MCVRVCVDEVRSLVIDLLVAEGDVLNRLVLDLAAGGCRNCRNDRRIDRDPFADLAGGPPTGRPCPTCVPRAEERLRRVARLRRPRRTAETL